MPTRTLTLINTRYQLDGVTPIVGEQEYVYLQTPGGFPVTDLEGRVYFNGQPWGQAPVTNGSGTWTTTDVYPGDLRDGNGNPLATPAQLVVLEGGSQTTLSPPGFPYASSITVSTWYPTASGSAAGMLPMIIDLAHLDTTPAVGFPVLYTLSTSADAPDGRTYLGGVPIPESSNVNGISLITLWPTSLLNPTTTAYLAQLPDSTGTTWKFTVPTVPTGNQGNYAGGTTYHANAGTFASPADVVLWTDGLYYQYINATPASGHDPTNAVYWKLWPGEPVIWHRTEISGQGIPRIDATGVRQSPDLTTLIDDPEQAPTSLEDNLLNLAAQTGAALRTVTSTATLGAVTDDWLIIDATGGAFNLTFPAVSARSRPFWILKKDSAHTVTFVRAGSDTFNGATSFSLTTQYQWAVVKPDTAHGAWYVQTGGAGTSVITTQGDLEVGNSSGVAARLPIGTPGQIPGPVGADVDWLTPSGIPGSAGGADLSLAEGDILIRKKQTITALAIGYIGDSLTSTNPGSGTPATVTDTNLSTDGLTVTGANQGVSGTSTSDWLPGSTNLTSAKAAFVSGGVHIVHIMLGTNDARVVVRNSATTYLTNLQSIVSDLVGAGFLVVLSYPPYAVPGSNAGDQDATANTLRLAYQVKINQIVNGRNVFLGDTSAFNFFQANPSQLSDGIHPTVSGVANLATLWAAGLTPLVAALTQQVTLQPVHIGLNGQFLGVAGGYPAYQNVPGGMTNPMTAIDDIIVAAAGGVPARKGAGAPGQVLTTNASTGHVDWENSASGFGNPMTTPQDIIVGGTAGAAGRLGIGGNGQYLRAVAGVLAYDPGTHYEPVVLSNPGGTAPTFVVNSNGQQIMIPVSN